MVTGPAGWPQHFGANLVLFEGPGGAGTIRCHARLPLEPLSQVLRRVLSDADRWVVEETSPVVTAEGEYGAFSKVSTRTHERVGVRFIGCVFADDFAVVLEARVQRGDAAPMMESVARELVLKISLGLGAPRRRRFLYEPPPGWHGVPHGLITSWYPPGFPDDAAQLVVYPAEPTTADPAQEVAQLLTAERERGARIAGTIEREPLQTSSGLSGESWAFEVRGPAPGGALVYRELATLTRPPYRYALKLESRGGAGGKAHRAAFLAAATSVAALPPVGQQYIGAPIARSASSGLEHWAE